MSKYLEIEYIVANNKNKNPYYIIEGQIIQYYAPYIGIENEGKKLKNLDEAEAVCKKHIEILVKEKEINEQAALRMKGEVDPLIKEIEDMFNIPTETQNP